MTVAIRQEINIINRVIAETIDDWPALHSFSDIVEIDPDSFNGDTYYFELVWRVTDDTGSSGCHLRLDDGSTTYATKIMNSIVSDWERSRIVFDTALSGATELYLVGYGVGSGTDMAIEIKSAKVIILQSATDITDTQTQIEVGAYELWADVATAETYEPLSEPKYWKYESDKWDPTPTFKLGFTAVNENDMDTSRVALQESSDAAFTSPSTVTNSVVSFNVETVAYYESSVFTPTDGYYYRLVYTNDNTKYGGTIYNAKIVATQVAGSIRHNANYIYATERVYGGTGTSEVIGQSITTIGAITVDSIFFYMLSYGSPTDNLTCYITTTRDGDTPITNGTSQNFDAGTMVAGKETWVKFTFSTPPSLSATTKYWFKIQRSGSRDTVNYVAAGSGETTGYASGEPVIRDSGTWSNETSGRDLYFSVMAVGDAITKLQPEYLLINAAQADTGLQEYLTYFDPDEWDGVDNDYYHEHSADDPDANSKLYAYSSGALTHKDVSHATDTYGGVFSDGTYIFVGCNAAGLRSYSVDGSGNLTLEDTDDQGGYHTQVYGDGSFIYVSIGPVGLRSYTVDGSGNLTYKDTDDQGGTYMGMSGDGDFLYVACGASGLRSYSVDGSGILTAEDVDVQATFAYRDVYCDGTYIYVACDEDGLRSYSADVSGNLTYIDVDDQSGIYTNVDGDGTYIYVACSLSGLRSYSVDGSGNLTHISADDQGDQYTGVYCSDGLIYAACQGGGLRTYRVDSSGNLIYLNVDDQGGAYSRVHGDSNFIYAVCGTDGLRSYTAELPYDIANSDITGDDLVRSSSALTMPATAKEIDSYIVTA